MKAFSQRVYDLLTLSVSVAIGGLSVYASSDAANPCDDHRYDGSYPKVCLGPEPNPQLTNAEWLMLDATTAHGEPVEGVSRLLNDGTNLWLTVRHGTSSIPICNHDFVAQFYSPTTFTFDPSKTYPDTRAGCVGWRAQAVSEVAAFFRPSVTWVLDGANPRHLTLSNPNGTIYRFVDALHRKARDSVHKTNRPTEEYLGKCRRTKCASGLGVLAHRCKK